MKLTLEELLEPPFADSTQNDFLNLTDGTEFICLGVSPELEVRPEFEKARLSRVLLLPENCTL